MQKNAFIALLLLSTSLAFGQTSVKKYVLIEHFTNSKCGICASRNPAFYSTIGQTQNADDIHHIAIHPSFPYSDCVFYQYNTADNNARVGLYSFSSTPRVAINGTLIAAGNPLLTQATLDGYSVLTSPIAIKVTETSTGGSNYEAKVDVTAFGAVPAGNYKLFAILVEKLVEQQTPNGETVHRDVLRKIVNGTTGTTFTAPAIGQTATFNFNYSVAGLNANQAYIVAFVQNMDTKAVLNSGTKFDPVLVSSEEATEAGVRLAPNPATNYLRVELPNASAVKSVEIYGMDGKAVRADFDREAEAIQVSLVDLPAGHYFIRIETEGKLLVKPFIKE